MTDFPVKRPSNVPEEQLFRELEKWEAQLTSPPTIWDEVKQPNINVLGGFILHNFRIAAKDVVRSRESVKLLRDLAILAIGETGEAERFLRAPPLLSTLNTIGGSRGVYRWV